MKRTSVRRRKKDAYGNSEMIFVASSNDQARAVRLRTNPRLPLANAYLAMLSPFAVSIIWIRSYSPEVRKICLISQPHFLASSLAAWARLRSNTALREVQGHDEQHIVLPCVVGGCEFVG